MGAASPEQLLKGKARIEHQIKPETPDLFSQPGQGGGLHKGLAAGEGDPVDPPGGPDLCQQLRRIDLAASRRIVRLRVMAAGAAVRAALKEKRKAKPRSVDDRFGDYPGQAQLHGCAGGAK